MENYNVELLPEICCDECFDVIHNHFDCPSCGKKYAGTTIYGSIEDQDENFFCEECGTEFAIIDYDCGTLIISKIERNDK